MTTQTPPVAPAPPALKRSPVKGYTPRPIYWLDWREEPDIAAFLRDIPAHDATLFVLGGTDIHDTPPRDWLTAPAAHGWHVTGPRDDHATTYTRDGITVSLYMTAAWFPGADDLDRCRRAYAATQALIRRAWEREAAASARRIHLMPTPAQTGLDLLETVLPHRAEYPCLPSYLQTLIRANFTQGRRELLTLPSVGDVPAVYCLDAKLQYAACVTGMPVGIPYHDNTPVWREMEPAFYRVSATVPAGWDHIGILPTRAEVRGEWRTLYPATPGTEFSSWCSGAELQIAYEHEWPVTIRERIHWPQSSGRQRVPDPLREWKDRLVDLREYCDAASGSDIAPLVSAAIRSLIIHPLGSFHRAETRERHITPYDQSHTIPTASALDALMTEAGVEWWRDRPLSAWARRWQHPEWSAMVWGKARARQTRRGLLVPREWLIASRTDGWWMTTDPGWEYTGKPGSYRLKRVVDGPVTPPVPRFPGDDEPHELLSLMRSARGV